LADHRALAPLAGLLTAQRKAAEGRLRALRAEADRLLAAIARLDQAPGTAEPLSPAHLAGADLRWRQWADHQRARLMTDLAALRARMLIEEEGLRKHLGREEATLGLMADARAAALRNQDRRQEWLSAALGRTPF
jgi:hypothetical protein